MRGSRKTLRDQAAEYLEGEISSKGAADFEEQLDRDTVLRRALADERTLHENLGTLPPELEGVDLTEDVDRALRVEPPRRARSVVFALAGAAAMVFGMVWVWNVRSVHREPPSLGQLRGGKSIRASSARSEFGSAKEGLTGLRIMVVDETGHPRAAPSVLTPDTELVFAYRNEGRVPAGYLMVFGRDARGEIHWFHPATPIRSGGWHVLSRVPGERRPPIGPFEVVGVFLGASLKPQEVEALLKGGRTIQAYAEVRRHFEVVLR